MGWLASVFGGSAASGAASSAATTAGTAAASGGAATAASTGVGASSAANSLIASNALNAANAASKAIGVKVGKSGYNNPPLNILSGYQPPQQSQSPNLETADLLRLIALLRRQ